MRRAISLVTQTLRFDFCAIWELVPETHQLHLQTGVGWPESMIGMPLLDTDERSQEGQTIRKREPVIISGREHQIDCANTQFIRQYGIESSVCVSIHGKGHPFGLFCGYNTQPRKFTLDEVHFLQVAADVLAQAVERQRADVAEHEQRALAEALRESAAALNSTLNLEKVLELILANIERVVPHHAAHIMLIEQDQAVVARHYGYAVYGLEEPLVSRPFSTLDHPHLRQMVETGQPLVIRDKSAYSSWWNDLSGTCLPSYVGAPIRREDETIGFLHLDSALPNFFTPIHAERLQAFADQAALAIANARLFEQSRNLAMMEERQRLARDLHDAVSQTLFSASVVAEALPRLWNRDSEAVQQGLEELHLLTRGALAEMRTLLLELRPTALIETRFDELLRHLTQAFSGKNRITVELGIIEGVPALPPNVQVALYRIVQEALNNIAKHARASHVAITLSQTDEQIILCVKDDGRGFDQSLRAPNRFGLQIMQERARGIEASYTIKSEPGHGTEITVQWPEDL
jgi:two-component system nitrate/nitrite sensor histidine kinase NarX